MQETQSHRTPGHVGPWSRAGSAALIAALLFVASPRADDADVRNLAERFLSQHTESWTDLPSASALRLRISGDPVVESMLIWDADGSLSFPPVGGVPHITEDRLLKERGRVSALRSANPAQRWEPAARGSERYYWCSDDRCLLVNGTALMDALGLASRRHVELAGAPAAPRPSLASRPVFLGGAVVLSMGLAWLLSGRLRKREAEPETDERAVFRFAHAEVDAARLVIRDEQGERDLSRREYALLKLFASRPAAVISKDDLYDAGWGRNYQPSSRALDQQILNLRRKLDPERRYEPIIETVHGQGYRFKS